MEDLNKAGTLYFEIKDEIKRLTNEKKQLESKMYNLMETHNISTIDLDKGRSINYNNKRSLVCKKDQLIDE